MTAFFHAGNHTIMKQLDKDQEPWVAVAADVLNNVHTNADSSTRESLKIGLQNNPHPTCVLAVKKLAEIADSKKIKVRKKRT